jgi:hypothetical protein
MTVPLTAYKALCFFGLWGVIARLTQKPYFHLIANGTGHIKSDAVIAVRVVFTPEVLKKA